MMDGQSMLNANRHWTQDLSDRSTGQLTPSQEVQTSFTRDSNMGLADSATAQTTDQGDHNGRVQTVAQDGGLTAATTKKRKRAEIAPSELRDLGLVPFSEQISPSQSRNGSRAASPVATSNPSQPQISSRNRTSTKKASRNIDRVFFGAYEIKTWYYSPYPFEDEDWVTFNPPIAEQQQQQTKLSGRSSGKASESGSGNPLSRRTDSESNVDGRSSSDSNDHIASQTSQITESASMPTSFPIGGALSSSVIDAPVLSAALENGESGPSEVSVAHAAASKRVDRKLWVCEGCFKYMRSYAGWNSHKKQCTFTHPPGKKVYQRGAHIIWEVDGAQAKLYAQNLSLFGKLFIDHKTIYFDVEPFTFYVLTDATTQFDHALGYFSKEKISYDDYNLACIITFPPFQQKGFGTLMIEFSYYLSSLTNMPGTPERPLSDLGLQGYLSFWSSVVLRTLIMAFNDAESPSICLPYVGSKLQSANAPASIQRLRVECLRIRRILLGLPPQQGRSREKSLDVAEGADSLSMETKDKPKRNSYGWAGELKRHPSSSSASSLSDSHHTALQQTDTTDSSTQHSSRISSASTSIVQPRSNASGRTLRTRIDKGKEKEKADSLTPPPSTSSSRPTAPAQQISNSHLLTLEHEKVGLLELSTNLERIAEAANLRLEDCSQALMECGLLNRRLPSSTEPVYANGHVDGASEGDSSANDHGKLTLIITLDKVREGIRQKGVKRQMLDVDYVL